MIIVKNETHTLITPNEKDVSVFLDTFKKQLKNLKNEHLILNFLENINTSLQDILLFLDTATDCREKGTSFVIVCTGVEIDDIPDEISVTPTLHEALDILEMDIIERDLLNF
ncbi:MAG: hypothetical protein KAH07_04370 [Flavobacteriaceae bacterium]|nr:hypothetical protein [Flavobacteriaceae bacterium]